MKRVLVIANTAWNVTNFRSGLIDSLRASGFAVYVAAPFDGSERVLWARGCCCRDLGMNRTGANPIQEFLLLTRIFVLIKNLKPQAVFSFTIKPNLYGGIACRLLGVPFAPNITGLGTVFIHRSILTRIVTLMYRFAYHRAARVFFQNHDDLAQFTSLHIVSHNRARRIPGSGVDLARFRPREQPASRGVTFLFIGRFLLDKGVSEYAAAAALVRQSHPAARFLLLGSIDGGNRRSVSQVTVDRWTASGAVEVIDRVDDVRPAIASSDCVVLPSYREGLSRTLLEAAAMGRPIITTDVPGCRDAVEDGVTGFVCRVRNAGDLAEKMIMMLRLTPSRREEMGINGRRKAEREFDERIVIRAYQELIGGVPQAGT